MSHLHERKEKICLNCNAALIGRYCHHCGQENLEPKETVWHLVQHFFNDITHFDGKFFSSVGLLMRKPGFLSKEYMLGRRASYLNPIRMYVFSSAIFFLLLLSLRKHEGIPTGEEKTDKKDEYVVVNLTKGKTVKELREDRARLLGKLTKEDDDGDRDVLKSKITAIDMELGAIRHYYGDTTTRTFDKTDLGVLLVRATKDQLHFDSMAEGALDTVGAVARAAREGKKELLQKTGDSGTYRYQGLAAARVDSEDRAGRKEKKDLAQKIGDKIVEADDKRLAKKAEKKEAGVQHGDTVITARGTTIGKDAKLPEDDDDFDLFGLPVGRYRSVAQYDSAQAALPEDARDGWFTRQATRKAIVAMLQYRADKDRYVEYFIENLFHNIPKILFISLPIFAMILNILYYRQKKTYYYVSHGIFTIHVFIANFILGMAIILLNKLYKATDLRLVHFFTGLSIFLIIIYQLIYLYKAMRGFYGQGRLKTFVKYCITCWVAFFVVSFLFVLFVLISAITI